MPVFPVGDESYDKVYAEEAAMVDASELLAEALSRSGMTKAELARRMNVSRSEITARLTGGRNITVRKLAATLHALGETLELGSARPRSAPDRSIVRMALWVQKTGEHSAPRRPIANASAYRRDLQRARG